MCAVLRRRGGLDGYRRAACGRSSQPSRGALATAPAGSSLIDITPHGVERAAGAEDRSTRVSGGVGPFSHRPVGDDDGRCEPSVLQQAARP